MKSGFYISDYTVFAILQTADVILPTVCINNTFLLPNIKRKHQIQHNQNQNKSSTTQSKFDPKHNTAVCINNTFLLLDIHRKHQTQDNQNQNIKHKTSKSQTKHNQNQEHTPKGRGQLKKNVFFRALPKLWGGGSTHARIFWPSF